MFYSEKPERELWRTICTVVKNRGQAKRRRSWRSLVGSSRKMALTFGMTSVRPWRCHKTPACFLMWSIPLLLESMLATRKVKAPCGPQHSMVLIPIRIFEILIQWAYICCHFVQSSWTSLSCCCWTCFSVYSLDCCSSDPGPECGCSGLHPKEEGRGSLPVLASSLNPRFTNLPTSSIFLP